jgi:phage terminase Nu1 subunit (DNA packaging protein)
MELVTVEELARQFKVTVPAIRSWTRQGLPCHRLGRCVRFDPVAALAWFKERQQAKEQHHAQN